MKAWVQGRFKVSTKELSLCLGRISRTFFVDQSVRNRVYSVRMYANTPGVYCVPSRPRCTAEDGVG